MDSGEIIFSMPVSCGERGCPVRWHISHYWADDDGTYSVCDVDGNHNDVDEAAVPTTEQHREAWLEYARHVEATGEDPLHEFFVRRTIKKRQAWRVQIVNSIVGPIAARVMRGRREVARGELPLHVVSYLNLDESRRRLRDFSTWRDLVAADVRLSRVGWHSFTLDVESPRLTHVVMRELQAAARKHLARSDERSQA